MDRTTKLALSVALGSLVIVLDVTISIVAIPVLMAEFTQPLTVMSWVTTAYVLGVVATMPLAAWLGRRYGYRRMFTVALIAFCVASVGVASAQGPWDLIAARAAQGFAGGLITPLASTLALAQVPSATRGRIAALLGLPVLIGPVLGPVIAGLLIESIGWRMIFALTIPPAIASAMLVRRYAPADTPERATPPDFGGIVLLVPGGSALVFGLAAASAPIGIRLAVATLGIAAIAGFLIRSRRHRAPLLDVTLFRQPIFAASATVVAATGTVYFGSMVLLPTYIQVTRGDSAVIAGTMSIAIGLGAGLSLQVCTRLIDRHPAHRIVTTGLLIAATGTGLLAATLRLDSHYPLIAVFAAMLGIGAGAALMPSITTGTRALTGTQLASGMTMMMLISQLFTALGAATLAAVFSTAATGRNPAAGAALDRGFLAETDRLTIGPDLVDAQRLAYLGVALVFAATAVFAYRTVRLPQAPSTSASRSEACECS